MGWKDWPYWLKGGIIGIVLSVLGIILYFLTMNAGFIGAISYIPTIASILFPLNWIHVVPWSTGGDTSGYLTGSLYNVCSWIILGWIYGLIKRKKNINSSQVTN